MKIKKIIIVPLDENVYNSTISDRFRFRVQIDRLIEKFPELFPAQIRQGYVFNGWAKPVKKQEIIRRIIQLKCNAKNYLIHPCFIMPYLRGKTKEISKGLRLRKYNLPYHEIADAHGQNAMFWYRAELSLSRYSLVGTTVKTAQGLPKHILVDEHHDKLLGQKVYICTTVGSDCFLGAEVCANVSYEALQAAYSIFKIESQMLNSHYWPLTINMDGFASTKKAVKHLFNQATIIRCFLHGYLKIERHATKYYDDWFNVVSNKVWKCYEAKDKFSFAQNIRRLKEWTETFVPQGKFKEAILTLCQKKRVHQILRLCRMSKNV